MTSGASSFFCDTECIQPVVPVPIQKGAPSVFSRAVPRYCRTAHMAAASAGIELKRNRTFVWMLYDWHEDGPSMCIRHHHGMPEHEVWLRIVGASIGCDRKRRKSFTKLFPAVAEQTKRLVVPTDNLHSARSVRAPLYQAANAADAMEVEAKSARMEEDARERKKNRKRKTDSKRTASIRKGARKMRKICTQAHAATQLALVYTRYMPSVAAADMHGAIFNHEAKKNSYAGIHPHAPREKELKALISKAEDMWPAFVKGRPKYVGQAVSDGDEFGFSPEQTISVTQIGWKFTTEEVTETLDAWLQSCDDSTNDKPDSVAADSLPKIAEKDWKLELQTHGQLPSTARIHFRQPKHVIVAYARLKACANMVKHELTPGGDFGQNKCWRVFKGHNPQQDDVVALSGEQLLKQFGLWLNEPRNPLFAREPTDELTRLEKLRRLLTGAGETRFAYRLKMKIWIDNVMKVTAVRVGFIDDEGHMLPKKVSRPFTVMIFLGHENEFGKYAPYLGEQLALIVDERIVHTVDVNQVKISYMLSLYVSLSDHAATKYMVGSTGGSSESRDFCCPGNRAKVFGRVLCPGVCKFKVKDAHDRWFQQRKIEKELHELKGKKRPVERRLLARKFHFFEATHGFLSCAPAFAFGGELLMEMLVVPPAMHNGVFMAQRVLAVTMNFLIDQSTYGYSKLVNTYTKMVEYQAQGTIAASAGTIRELLMNLRKHVYDGVRAKHRGRDSFKSGFASLLVLQQSHQILFYDSWTPNTVYRRLALRVISCLLVLELYLAHEFFEGAAGRKRVKIGQVKKEIRADEYKLEMRRLYTADVGHNAVEFDHMHLQSPHLTLAHLVEEEEERMQSSIRDVAQAMHNNYAIKIMLTRETQEERLRGIKKRHNVRSQHSRFEIHPEYHQCVAIHSCLFRVNDVYHFNLTRLLQRIYRTPHYSHLVFFGYPHVIIFQTTAGPPRQSEGDSWFDLAKITQTEESRDRQQRWVFMRNWRSENSETKWAYDADAATYFNLFFNSPGIRPQEAPEGDHECEESRRRRRNGAEQVPADEMIIEPDTRVVWAHTICHCEDTSRHTYPMRTTVPSPRRASVKVTDLLIQHYIAVKNARTICAIRSLRNCYAALENQRIAKRDKIYQELKEHFESARRCDLTAHHLKKCKDTLSRLAIAETERKAWESARREKQSAHPEQKWRTSPAKEDKKKLQQLYTHKRAFYAELVTTHLLRAVLFLERFWHRELRSYQELLFEVSTDPTKCSAAGGCAMCADYKHSDPDRAGREILKEVFGKMDEVKDSNNETTVPANGAEWMAVQQIVALLRKFQRWRVAHDALARVCDTPSVSQWKHYLDSHGPQCIPPFLRYSADAVWEKEARVIKMAKIKMKSVSVAGGF
jgi:hypothetical protein